MGDYPKAYHVYEYSYPEAMPELGGIVFYVGKATGLNRIDDHLREAGNGVESRKCDAIRSIWSAGLIPVRRIVFETISEGEALEEERRRILLHKSSHLTNVAGVPNKKQRTRRVDSEVKTLNNTEHVCCPKYDIIHFVSLKSITNQKRDRSNKQKVLDFLNTSDSDAFLDMVEMVLDPRQTTFVVNEQGYRMPRFG